MLGRVSVGFWEPRQCEREEADLEDAILANEDGPLVLRTNGVLMLGVTRIYSRKVQYLLDDCKETRDRISLVSLILRVTERR